MAARALLTKWSSSMTAPAIIQRRCSPRPPLASAQGGPAPVASRQVGSRNAGARQRGGGIVVPGRGHYRRARFGAPPREPRHRADLIGREKAFHLRCTRSAGPRSGNTAGGEAERLARLAQRTRPASGTRAQILTDFESIAGARNWVSSGAGPRRLQELEMDALRRYPDCSVLGRRASGSNLSVPRAAFLSCGVSSRGHRHKRTTANWRSGYERPDSA